MKWIDPTGSLFTPVLHFIELFLLLLLVFLSPLFFRCYNSCPVLIQETTFYHAVTPPPQQRKYGFIRPRSGTSSRELPCSHYFCLPTHMITLFSPIHFIPLCSAFSVNFFSPKATVWLMLGLFRSPCFHPNCLTPTGTLRGVRLCSLLWAHTSAPHAPHFTQFILFLMPLRRRLFLRAPIWNNFSQERLKGVL